MGRPATLKVDIVTDAKGVGPGVDQAESRLSKFGGAAKKFGAVAAVGLGVAAAAAVKVGVDCIGAASDVQQSFGALDSIFGKSSAQVKAWAATAADSVGLSKSEYASLAGLVGAQLQNMGKSQAESAGQTKNLIGLGADLAATYGGTVSDAVEAVSSLLKGERDPIERYGVSINQAAIDAELASKGLGNLKGKALAQAQATATLTLLTKQTANAHGAFAKETNTLGGQQERLKAKVENLKASLGQRLLPAATAVTSFFVKALGPGLTNLSGKFGQLLDGKLAPVSRFVTGTLIPGLGRLAGFIGSTIPGYYQKLLAPALSGLSGAFRNVQGAIERNRPALEKLAHFLGVVIPPAARLLGTILGTTLGLAFRVVGGGISAFLDLLGRVIGVVDRVAGKLSGLASVASKVGGLVGKINPFGGVQLATMTPALGGGVGGLGPMVGQLATAAAGDGFAFTGGGGGAGGGGGVVVVDRRTIRVDVKLTGPALDGPGIVRKLQDAMRAEAVRLGRATAYGAAS